MAWTRDRRLLVVAAPAFVGAAAIGVVAVLALSSSGSDSHVSAVGSDSPSTSLTESSTSPTPSATKPSPSEAQLPSPPATTSGGLTGRTLPKAKSLGPGWVFRVDQGSAEGGYVGNGTPTLARDPHEVVMTVLPLGCEQRSDIPTPTHVLEADYKQRAHGTPGVGLRLRFASAKVAGQFVAARQTDLNACATQPLELADRGHRLVTDQGGTGDGTYVSVRTDPTLAKADRSWTEVAGWLGGRDVVLLAINATPSSAVVDVAQLSSAVRAVLR